MDDRPKCDYCGVSGGLVFWYLVYQGASVCMHCAPLETNGDESGNYGPPGPPM